MEKEEVEEVVGDKGEGEEFGDGFPDERERPPQASRPPPPPQQQR